MPRNPRSLRRRLWRRGQWRVTGWEPIKEYANGALWVLPSLAAVLAVIAGYTLTQIEVPPGSLLERLAFQGTADDARVLLISVTSTPSSPSSRWYSA